jgi:LPXTG-site transpeptidase (sortase) family protein
MQTTKHSLTIQSQLWERKYALLAAFTAVFLVTLGVLTAVGLTPELRTSAPQASTNPNDGYSQTLPQEPVRVVAAAVGLDDTVANPASADIATLDRALLSSSVRYPGSALLNEDGNVLLFGHSSYLRTTLNPAYKAFNDIQKLKTGETVTVYSSTHAYEYRVTSVRFVRAEDAVIDLRREGPRRLTLVTCNSFATKSDRFVVEAEFVKSYSIGN